MKCSICEKKEFKMISTRVRDSSKYKIVKCQDCGLLQLSPKPLPDKEQEFYDQNRQSKNIGEPQDLKAMEENSLIDTKRRAELILKEIPKGKKVLDIGSGYGFFLKELKNLGYNITGIDISKEKREISLKITDAEVLNINLLENEAELPIFDCITLFHVLEHISDPVRFLQIIKKHLKGKLIIEVPNVDDLLLKECKGYRDFYWQMAHLSYFNDRTLKRVVKEAGFLVDKIFYTHRYSIENFMNWFVLGKPQIEKPNFKTKGDYKWLEDYYKDYLCKIGKSDTLVSVLKSNQ